MTTSEPNAGRDPSAKRVSLPHPRPGWGYRIKRVIGRYFGGEGNRTGASDTDPGTN